MNTDRRVLIVGAGLAGWRTAKGLRRYGHTGPITLLGDETGGPYDRPPLSKQFLAGEWDLDRVILASADDLAAAGIEFVGGTRAVSVTPDGVRTEAGETYRYDVLVAATGARARRLPDQPESDRIRILRTLDDSRRLRDALATASHLMVVGGGFVGAEVASVARGRGVDVTLIEAHSTPFGRVLGADVGGSLARRHGEHGVRLACDVRVSALAEHEGEVTVRLADGRELAGDVALVSVGSVLNTDWLPEPAPQGVRCDQHGRVVDAPDRYAVGDIGQWWDPTRRRYERFEHWTNAGEQADVVAMDLLGVDRPRPPHLPYFWSDQFGTKLQMVGWPDVADRVVPLPLGITDREAYLYVRDGRLCAAVGFGCPGIIVRLRPMVSAQLPLEDIPAAFGGG